MQIRFPTLKERTRIFYFRALASPPSGWYVTDPRLSGGGNDGGGGDSALGLVLLLNRLDGLRGGGLGRLDLLSRLVLGDGSVLLGDGLLSLLLLLLSSLLRGLGAALGYR